MPAFTPSERRGALVLLALCALGAAWDLLHARPAPAPPADRLAPVVTATAAPAPAEGASPPPVAGPLDLNSATAAQLDQLPGIGPVLASRILEHRRLAGPFRSADELLAVRGIGARLAARLRPLVRVGSAPQGAGADTVQNATPLRR